MLPRELIEKLPGGRGAPGFHVFVALTDAFDGLLVILAFPLEIIGENIVERIGGGLPPSACEILQFG